MSYLCQLPLKPFSEKNSEFNSTLKQDNDRLRNEVWPLDPWWPRGILNGLVWPWFDLSWPQQSAVVGEYKHREEQYSKVINGMKEREDLMEQKVTHKQWLIVSWASWVTPVQRYYLQLTMDCRGNLYFRWQHWRKQEKQMERNWMRLWMTSWKRWVKGVKN